MYDTVPLDAEVWSIQQFSDKNQEIMLKLDFFIR